MPDDTPTPRDGHDPEPLAAALTDIRAQLAPRTMPPSDAPLFVKRHDGAITDQQGNVLRAAPKG